MTNAQIQVPAHYIPMMAISYADVDGSAQPASMATPLPVSGSLTIAGTPSVLATRPLLPARNWVLGATLDITGFTSVRVQIDGIANGDSIAFACSLAAGGATYPVQVLDQAGNAFLGVTTPGIYTVDGQGFITVTQNGSASSPVVTVAAYA